MLSTKSLFVKFKDSTGVMRPMDCSSLSGSLIEGAVGGAACGLGILAACRIAVWVNKLIEHVRS